jgi:hypothetical protein
MSSIRRYRERESLRPACPARTRTGMNTKQREPYSRQGEPTDAAPGSPRKIRVLMERASRREALFHPKDNLKRRLPTAPPEPELESEETAEEQVEADMDLAV